MRQETRDGAYATWVVPIADRLRDSRREVVRLASAFPEGAWELASPVPGWTYRDILAHLAEGDVFCQMTISAVIDGQSLDLRPQSAEREQRTARILAAGRRRQVSELIHDVALEGEETQALLASLSGDDEHVRVIVSNSSPVPVTLGDFLRSFAHDEEHIAHLREAIEVAP